MKPLATQNANIIQNRAGRGVEFLLLPSLYGFVGWIGALGVYLLSPYEQYFAAETWALIAYTLFLFLASMLVFALAARRSLPASELMIDHTGDKVWFLITLLIGGYGLYIYIRDFSSFFGGLSSFVTILSQSSLDVRGAAQEVGGLGFQVSYLSWVAVFFGLILGLENKHSLPQKTLFLGVAFILFVLNLAFVDRTRPIWILMVCLFGFVVSRPLRDIKPVRAAVSVGGIPLIIFFSFAVISGKFDVRSGLFDNFVIYVTGGFGYFDSMVTELTYSPVNLAQTFLPITKILKGIGIIDFVPPEILEFRMVPFPTNVGTFLQPLFADGNLPLLIIGLPILVLGTDWLAIACFRMRTVMGRFFWANLSFTMLVSFFVPKYNNTAIYVFASVLLLDKIRRIQSGRAKLRLDRA